MDRTTLSFVGAACVAAVMSSQSLAQAPPAPTPYTLQPGWIEPGLPRPPYVPPMTPQGTGPYPAIMVAETVAPGADFVSYYPADLSQLGRRKLPIVMWANGSCLYVGNRTRHYLQELASHGYLVMAGGILVTDGAEEAENIDMSVNPVLTDPDAPRNPAPAAARAAPATAQQQFDMSNDPTRKRVTHELLDQGIKWVTAENKRAGSKFFGKLDTAKIAVMGTSCGGGVAGTFAGDPRVKTLGIWNSGFGTNEDLRAKLNQPVLNITGDPRYDPAFWGAIKGFEALRDNDAKAPVFNAWRVNMVHMNTFRQTNGGEVSPITVAWLDWQLKDDRVASQLFTGRKCGLCTNSRYHVRRLNMD